MARTQFELEVLAVGDAKGDLDFNYMFDKKHKFSQRRRRAQSFTSEEDKNEYYRQYNKHYAILRDLKIHNAKKFLRSEGYIVMEKE